MSARHWPMGLLLLLGSLSAREASAVDCAKQRVAEASCVVCRVDVQGERLQLAYAATDGARFESFVALHDSLVHEPALGCDEALYLDGSISSLFSTQLDRADHRARLGPMFKVTVTE